ncbi:MAG: serine/threonine protein kinase [Planctomycetaceae bacterium]|nr:serine/threonine protein kinase [Planctomycetaceae bacterium]
MATASLSILLMASTCLAGDRSQFRGANGSGVSDEKGIATNWDGSKNIVWKTDLPGAGTSSAIVVGDRIFLTAFSGYGDDGNRMDDLQRHVICVDRKNGKILWDKPVPAVLPEDSYRGFLTEHGYASSTPVCDGEHVFVFFGKSGVLAFDMEGYKKWQVSVGTESSGRRWGSAASPILYKNSVIVNASDESQSIRALDKKTGKELWKAEASGLELTFNTPSLIEADGRTDLVVAVPYEVWGLNPDTGKLAWYAETDLDGNVSPSLVHAGGIAYAIGGRSGGSLALKVGGKGDVTKNIQWTSRETSYVPSPVLVDGHLYWVNDRGIAYCVNAKTGDTVYRERLEIPGGGGFNSRPFYSSVVAADGKLYAVSRRNGTFVLSAKPEFKQIAHNVIDDDHTDFNATPAISHGQIFIRSNKVLYCIVE